MVDAREMKGRVSCEYYPSEIAHTLLRYTECSVDVGVRLQDELEDAIYQLRAIAENEYNSDYWRVLWNALQNMTEALEYT